MTDTTRPKPTRMTVCDLCDQEIPDGEPSERGSLTHGWLAHPVEVGERPTGWRRTTHAWLHWPPAERVRRARLEKRLADPEQFRQRRYDFHAECILRLVEAAVVAASEGTVAVELGEGERLELTARPGSARVLAGTMRDGRLQLDAGVRTHSGVEQLRPPPDFFEPLPDPVVPDNSTRALLDECTSRRDCPASAHLRDCPGGGKFS